MNLIKSFLQKIKPKTKYILGVLGIAAIVSQGAFAFTQLSATGSKFNSMENDSELLQGKNDTAGDTVWKDPVSGNTGDTFRGLVYYHNTEINTTAENTRIKVAIPAQTTNKTAKLSATISADGVPPISDTIVNGQVIGLSGLTVNLNQDANLALVPGSVKWFPNKESNPENIPQVLPNGQTGNEITSANGINIGGIEGCWNFAGYVTFSFKTTPISAPALTVEKTVRNVSAGEASFVELTNASANQVVEFKVDSKNTGNTALDNLKLKDSLPAKLSFVPGSMKIFRNGSGVAENVSDANAALVFAGGWNTGTLEIAKTDTLTFQAKAPASINVAETLTNTATATSGALLDSDTAKVVLNTTPVPCIVKNKDAKNITTGQVATPHDVSGQVMKTIAAKPGDTIEYTLTTKNTGGAAANGFIIKDGINDVLQEANFVSASDGGQVINTGLAGDEARQIQYGAINIAPGQTVVRTFTVKVMNPLPSNPTNGNDFDHNLFNIYGDKVLVNIAIPTPPVTLPILHIEKTVRDFTVNELNFSKSNIANAGDTLEYRIAFSNTGNGPADQVTFSDALPIGLTYVPGSATVSMNGGAEVAVPDGIAGNGILVGTIAAGDSGVIKFKAVSAANIAGGTFVTNTANLTDNGVTISDTASTVFRAPIVTVTTPVVKTSLPKTGANSVELAAIVAVLLAGAGALVYRKFA